MRESRFGRIAIWILCAAVAATLALSAGNASAAGPKKPTGGKTAAGKIGKTARRMDDGGGDENTGVRGSFDHSAHFGW